MAAKEQGINITVDDAQRVIDTIFTMYKGLQPFFQECGERALQDRWLCNCFGRFRRFPKVSDFDTGLAGEFERQAMNFPIQSMIASAMSRALAYLHDYLERHPGMFRILLQIHDAVLLEAKPEYVEHVTQKVLPWALRHMVEIFPTTLDGLPTGKGPYRLGLEAEVMKYWGVKLTEEEWRSYGFKQKHWADDGVVVHYSGA